MTAVNVVETPTYTANVQVPANGDPADQSAWLCGAQPLANRTAALREKIDGFSTAARRRWVPVNRFYTPGGWATLLESSTHLTILQTSTVSDLLYYSIGDIVPHAGTITGVFAYVLAAAGSHSSMPAVKPKIELVKYSNEFLQTSFSATPPTVLNSFSHAATIVSDYEKVQTIGGATTETIDKFQLYYLRIYGESGANSINNSFRVGGIFVEFTG